MFVQSNSRTQKEEINENYLHAECKKNKMKNGRMEF
jgi:hypothetical protein